MAKTDTKWIKDSAITKDKINTDVAGIGISGGAGSALDVDYGASALTARSEEHTSELQSH